MPHILVVEDDADIAALIAHYLERVGHRVERITSGTDVLPRLRKAPVDLVILDLMLPGLDGLVVCQAMRADPSFATIPIIMLTARGEESDRVSGLEHGADDYVTKPFSPKELSLRVTALLRRAGRASSAGALLQYGPITIDADRHTIALDGTEVRLTAKEFLLLQYLVQHKGRVLSRDLLLSDVWGYNFDNGGLLSPDPDGKLQSAVWCSIHAAVSNKMGTEPTSITPGGRPFCTFDKPVALRVMPVIAAPGPSCTDSSLCTVTFPQ